MNQFIFNDYQFSYFIGVLPLIAIWLLIFLLRKDLRKEMLSISIMFGIAGLLSEPIYAYDWWKPLTITNTTIGIEDFLFGFTVAGISSSIYLFLTKKKLVGHRKFLVFHEKEYMGKNKFRFWAEALSIATLFFVSFFVLKLHSFWASLIAILIPTFYIWYKRPDLILDSLLSGFIIVLVAIVGSFWFSELITPGWVDHTWLWDNLSGYVIAKAPLEDIIWFFITGLLIAPYYAYWQDLDIKSNSKHWWKRLKF